MPRDLDYFMDHPDEFAGLSDDDKARLYEGQLIQGDTAAGNDNTASAAVADPAAESGAAPAATSVPAAGTDTIAGGAGSETVVAAKDGKHTIPYEELAAARERAAQLERELEQVRASQQAQGAAASSGDGAAAASGTQDAGATGEADKPPTAVDLDQLEDQYQDALLEGDKPRATEIRRQINAEVKRQSEEAAYQKLRAEQSAAEEARSRAAVEQALREVAANAVKSYPFLDINSPQKNDAAIVAVKAWRDQLIANGTPPHEALQAAVNQYGPMFSGGQPKSPAVPQDAASAAAQAIQQAKVGIPASLSDIPAGTSSPHDEAAAVLNMSPAALQGKFSGMSPEQIETLMNRVL